MDLILLWKDSVDLQFFLCYILYLVVIINCLTVIQDISVTCSKNCKRQKHWIIWVLEVLLLNRRWRRSEINCCFVNCIFYDFAVAAHTCTCTHMYSCTFTRSLQRMWDTRRHVAENCFLCRRQVKDVVRGQRSDIRDRSEPWGDSVKCKLLLFFTCFITFGLVKFGFSSRKTVLSFPVTNSCWCLMLYVCSQRVITAETGWVITFSIHSADETVNVLVSLILNMNLRVYKFTNLKKKKKNLHSYFSAGDSSIWVTSEKTSLMIFCIFFLSTNQNAETRTNQDLITQTSVCR